LYGKAGDILSDENNKKNETSEDKLRKIDEFFNQFEEKTNNDPTNVEDFLLRFNEMEKQQQTEKEEIEARRKTRMDRLNEKKNNKQKREFLFNRKASTILNNEENNMEKNTANTANKKKKHKLNLKKFILYLEVWF